MMSLLSSQGATMDGDFRKPFDAEVPSELAGAKMRGLLGDSQRNPGVLATERTRSD
jgi:hypothetical protein